MVNEWSNLKSNQWKRVSGGTTGDCNTCNNGCTVRLFAYDDVNQNGSYENLFANAGPDVPLLNCKLDLVDSNGVVVASGTTDAGSININNAGYVTFTNVPEGTYTVVISADNSEAQVQAAIIPHTYSNNNTINITGCDGGIVERTVSFYLDGNPFITYFEKSCTVAQPSRCAYTSGNCHLNYLLFDETTGGQCKIGGKMTFNIYSNGTCTLSYYPEATLTLNLALLNHIYYTRVGHGIYQTGGTGTSHSCTHYHYNPSTGVCSAVANQNCQTFDFSVLINNTDPYSTCSTIHQDLPVSSGPLVFNSVIGVFDYTTGVSRLKLNYRMNFVVLVGGSGTFIVQMMGRILESNFELRFTIQQYETT